MIQCEVCKSNNVSLKSEIEDVKYKTCVLKVNTTYSICNHCEREFISKDQIIENENELNIKKREFDK